MPTTSNFGWTTPADTDLVKDGAAAIRTLGNGIDTSLVDLKGGTTGQVLAKATNADLDFTWTNGGDITEVAAGVGISGGGTSGAVTITNSMATAIDAKGDLVAGTGADAFARLAVGANNTVLTADSATATGLKWATPSIPPFIGVSCFGDDPGQFTLNANTNVLMTWNKEHFDTDSFHNTVTNAGRITIPSGRDGKYLISAQIEIDDNSSTGTRAIKLFKNGSQIKIQQGPTVASAGRNNYAISYTVTAVANDYFEIYAHSTVATNAYTYDQRAHFQAQFLGA